MKRYTAVMVIIFGTLSATALAGGINPSISGPAASTGPTCKTQCTVSYKACESEAKTEFEDCVDELPVGDSGKPEAYAYST